MLVGVAAVGLVVRDALAEILDQARSFRNRREREHAAPMYVRMPDDKTSARSSIES